MQSGALDVGEKALQFRKRLLVRRFRRRHANRFRPANRNWGGNRNRRRFGCRDLLGVMCRVEFEGLGAFRRIATTVMDLRKSADSGKVFRRDAQHVFELFTRLVELPDFEERAPERDMRGNIRGMPLQSGLAGVDGFLKLTEAPVLFGQRRKRDRRRVQLDPAFEFFDAIRHAPRYCPAAATVTSWLVVPVRPVSSTTVSVTVYVRGLAYEWLAVGDEVSSLF